ncbi:hypothetical protein H1R20_g6452, partial [Candolleomyces eurysporus]
MAIAILWASQCLGATQIRNGIVGTGVLLNDSQKAHLLTVHPDNIKPYNILILFVSFAYMAITLDVTGILQAAAFWVSNKGCSSGRKLYFYFYLLITLLSMIVGSDPVILSGTVFMVRYTAATGLNPDAWLISEFAAANTASMVLFVGNPTNAIICEGLRVNHATFTAYTVLPFVACSIACYLVLMLQYRNEKHVPRRLIVSGHLNPREVLRDPVSAIFGTIWLATFLVVAIVLSRFHVDVWKIALPFGGGKFVFDICWDHYRYSTGKIPKFDDRQRNGSLPSNTNSSDSDLHKWAIDSLGNDFQRAHLPRRLFIDAHRQDNESKDDILGDDLQRMESPVPVTRPDPALDKPFPKLLCQLSLKYRKLAAHFPTFFAALPQLPFGLIPFVFSQFILIEALEHQGWINIFSQWLVIASNKQMMPVIWLVGIFGVILCNISGTNIGATILLIKIIRASAFEESTVRAAAVSLAVASNIGAVSFTFSASLVGLLWVAILRDKGIQIKQWKFAMWNALPLFAMSGVGLGVVSAMMEVLY